MDLEISTQSEVNQTQKDKYHLILPVCEILNKRDIKEPSYKTEVETRDVENTLMVTRG